MNYNELKQIIIDQNDVRLPPQPINRSAFSHVVSLANAQQIIIISGMRRCGKSTLLQMARNKSRENHYYCNFDDERLVNFHLEDFQKLLDIFIELYSTQKTFYFDEIQNINGWERFIRRLHDSGNKIYITGFNATMFSRELGTKLTGRYIQVELYPFSFYEFVLGKNASLLLINNLTSMDRAQLKNLFTQYCEVGGIPDFVLNRNLAYLESLYESIIYRDIIVRYKVNERAIKELVYYLASNISKDISYNSLRKILGLASASTVSDYCEFLENSFLCFFVKRYATSLKKQLNYSKKSYFIDQALAKVLGFRTSDDYGRVLENIVFLELQRRGNEIFFHKAEKECDFVLKNGNKITTAIQVCSDLKLTTTREREMAGLIDALNMYNLNSGIILTDYESSREKVSFSNHELEITVMPVWEWLLQD